MNDVSTMPPSDGDAAASAVGRPGIHRRLYDWVLHWAVTPYGPIALFALSFAESSFFPIPPDVLLIALVIGAPKRWLRFALNCSVASVLGGAAGYAIGMFLWAGVGPFFHNHMPGFAPDSVTLRGGEQVVGLFEPSSIDMQPPRMHADVTYPAKFMIGDVERVLNKDDVDAVKVNPFTKAGALYAKYDKWIVATAGFTPLPYKVFTITAGVFKIDFWAFCVASALSRSARFFIVAIIMAWIGPKAKPFIDKYFNLLCVALMAAIIAGFALLKYL